MSVNKKENGKQKKGYEQKMRTLHWFQTENEQCTIQREKNRKQKKAQRKVALFSILDYFTVCIRNIIRCVTNFIVCLACVSKDQHNKKPNIRYGLDAL